MPLPANRNANGAKGNNYDATNYELGGIINVYYSGNWIDLSVIAGRNGFTITVWDEIY